MEAERKVRRDAVGVGLATGAYGISFGAVASAAGLSVPQAAALSLLMFTGGSQFAFVGVASSPLSGAMTAILLGTRNALYGLRLSALLDVHGARRVAAAQLTIDESSAMAIGNEERADLSRLAFWWTGLSVFVCWNVATVLGVLGAEALSDPAVLGLDAAGPAAFIALLAPRLRNRELWAVALVSAVVAVAVTPIVPAGVPVLCAAVVVVVLGFRR
ncbi:MAG: AzlC family protein [Actinomycetia bacterium]|nr:AzlC family protein [Actinomycetes bacterium]